MVCGIFIFYKKIIVIYQKVCIIIIRNVGYLLKPITYFHNFFHKKTPIVRGGETRFIVGVSHAKLTKWRVTLAVKISTSFVHHNRGGRDRQDRIFYETEKENQSKYRMGWFFFVSTKLYRQIAHKKPAQYAGFLFMSIRLFCSLLTFANLCVKFYQHWILAIHW